jgi:hypothetical protein
VTVELQGQVLARERELDSREGAIITWEEGLAAFAHMHVEVHTEHDTSHTRTDVVQWDFLTQVRTSNSRSEQLTDIGQTLEEHQILLCL